MKSSGIVCAFAVGVGLASLVVTHGAYFAADKVPTASKSSSTVALGRDVHVIDLTHAFDEQNVYWPTEIPFHFERGPFGMTKGGWFYSANRFRTAEHSGTHIDAPIHFFKEGHSADQVPLARLIGPGAVVDVAEKCRAQPDYLVSTADFEAWERRHKIQLDETIVLVRTGWDQFWPDRENISAPPRQGQRPSPNCIFRASPPRRPNGSSKSGGSKPSASTRPASTEAYRKPSARTSYCARIIRRHSKTWPASINCLQPALPSLRCR